MWRSLLCLSVLLPCVFSDSEEMLYGDITTNVEESDGILANWLFPTEVVVDEPSRGQGRTAEWYKQFKLLEPVANDSSITLTGSIEISSLLVGDHYTISAVLPGTGADNVYILRRRQDALNGLSEIDSTGTYARTTEGAIAVNCILQINISTASVISAFGNDTFYYPNAMVKDPQGNFWFSDAAQHQVLRMNPGRITPDVKIGKQFAPGKGTSRLCAPTDVAVTTSHIYVADGHCNDRVVLFNKTGGYIAEFGKAPSPSVLSSWTRDMSGLPLRYIKKPQALAVDELRNRLYIADSAESGQSRVVTVMAGEGNVRSFGTGIRYFKHREMLPFAGRIAPHPSMPYAFVINSYNTHNLHRGFTFNTHDTSFKGAWGPDIRGFVRPRALSVSPDGSTLYVADATEETPEKIWIFTTAEYLRSRRNTRLSSAHRPKGQVFNLNKDINVHSNYYNLHSSTKGDSRIDDNNRLYRSIYLRYLTQGKGSS